jgi:hypothetical protein
MTAVDEQERAIFAIQAAIAEKRPLSDQERTDARDHPYIVAGNLATWVVEGTPASGADDLRSFFDAVEKQIDHGTAEVRELMVVGLLEDIQNVSRHRNLSDELWIPFLGPSTLAMWRLLCAMWDGRAQPGELQRAISSPVAPRSAATDDGLREHGSPA